MNHNSNKRDKNVSFEGNITIKRAKIKVIVEEYQEVQENLEPVKNTKPNKTFKISLILKASRIELKESSTWYN